MLNDIDSVQDEKQRDKILSLFREENYKACIQFIKDHCNLEKDARYNNLLSMCYYYIHNVNEAVHYINKAIDLDKTNSVFLSHKASYLREYDLQFESLKLYNAAIQYAISEEEKRNITAIIMDLVRKETLSYSIYNLTERKIFEKYIYYFDSIINLNYCFLEYKEKYCQYKQEAISYFYNKQKERMHNYYGCSIDYEDLSKNLTCILRATGIEEKLKQQIQADLNLCNTKLEKEKEKSKTEEEAKSYIKDLFAKGYFEEEVFEATQHKFSSITEWQLEDIFTQLTNFQQKKNISLPAAPLPVQKNLQDTIKSYMELELTKAEMIEQLSADFGISEESAKARINAYYQNETLGLEAYFEDLLEEDDEDDDLDIDEYGNSNLYDDSNL